MVHVPPPMAHHLERRRPMVGCRSERRARTPWSSRRRSMRSCRRSRRSHRPPSPRSMRSCGTGSGASPRSSPDGSGSGHPTSPRSSGDHETRRLRPRSSRCTPTGTYGEPAVRELRMAEPSPAAVPISPRPICGLGSRGAHVCGRAPFSTRLIPSPRPRSCALPLVERLAREGTRTAGVLPQIREDVVARLADRELVAAVERC